MTATLDRSTSLSRSATRAAAEDMVRRYARSVGVELRPASIVLESGARVVVDGAAPDESLLVEAHPTPGSMRDVELAVATQDVFKLVLARRAHPGARAVVLVADDDARAALAGRVAGTPAAGLVEIRVCP